MHSSAESRQHFPPLSFWRAESKTNTRGRQTRYSGQIDQMRGRRLGATRRSDKRGWPTDSTTYSRGRHLCCRI